MKKIFMIVAALVLVLGLAVSCGKNSGIRTLDEIKESGKIVMVTDAAWAPFEYIADSETPVGADIDLATEIANSLGVELEIINATFDTISNYLESGEADMALAAITITDERKETMLFSEPYTIAQQYIITMENDDTVETIEDLAGKKIGVHLGTTGDFLVSDEVNGYEDEDGNPVTGVLQDTGAEVFQYKNLTEAALAMKNGDIDAIVCDVLLAKNLCVVNEGLKCFELFYEDGTGTKEELAIAVAAESKELMEEINKIIAPLIEDGTIDGFITKHSELAAALND